MNTVDFGAIGMTPPHLLRTGTEVDRYTLLARLGEGGQAEVWKARDPLAPATPRALKLMSLGGSRQGNVERLRREGRLLAMVSHPSVVRCRGLFEDFEREVLGIVMDFVSGCPLSDVVGEPRMTDEHGRMVMFHVAKALAYIHAKGIVHRDVKPSNVLLTDDFFAAPSNASHLALIDFGVAAMFGEERLTATGHVVGTSCFMAPEQLDPRTWGVERAGAPADVFALGLLGWRLFTRSHPLGLPADADLGEYAVGYRRAARYGSWPPHLDHPGAGIVKACLALHPRERPKAATVATAVEKLWGRMALAKKAPTRTHTDAVARPRRKK